MQEYHLEELAFAGVDEKLYGMSQHFLYIGKKC